MTTDITELVQRARINAECGEYLSPAETMELVEALESEKRICSTWRKTAEANSEKLEKAQQRIAELESRAVKLPKPHAHLIWIQAGHAPDDYWDDVAVSHSDKDRCCDGSERYPVYARWEIKEALSAIGINIAAAGKGEDS